MRGVAVVSVYWVVIRDDLIRVISIPLLYITWPLVLIIIIIILMIVFLFSLILVLS